MARIRADFIGGVIANDLSPTTTTLQGARLGLLPTVTAPDIATIILDPNGLFGEPEIVHITAHTINTPTAVVVRGQEGTTARAHVLDNEVPWLHGPTKQDWDSKSDHFTVTSTKVGDYTALPWDLVVCDPAATAFTVTLPPANVSGQTVAIRRLTSGATPNSITVARAGSDTINVGATSASIVLDNEVLWFTSNGTGNWTIAAGQKSLTSLDNRYSTLATNQTIAGTKTFSTDPIFNGPSGAPVHLSQTETVTGVKTFQGDAYFKSGSPWVDVKAYGAIGDGVTDDSAAVRSAIRSAASGGRVVYFPTGKYLIDADGILSDTNRVGLSGMSFIGTHYNASIIYLKTNGSERWLYNNGATSRLSEPYFENLGFWTDSIVNGNGFKITSNGHEQAFHFSHCSFQTMNNAHWFAGAVGNDNHRYYGCLWTNIHGNVYTLNNPQGVVHSFYGCQIHVNQLTNGGGHVFAVGSGGVAGSGEVHWHGGEILTQNLQGESAFVKIETTAAIGPGNCKLVFKDMKPEMNDINAKLVVAPGVLNLAEIVFEDCNFDTVQGGDREAVTIGAMKQVLFRRCRLPSTNTFSYGITGATTASTGAHHGEIGFEECAVPSDLSNLITLAGSLGRAWARGCYLNTTSVTQREATDFDFNWENTGKGDVAPRVKLAVMKFAVDFNPETGGDEALVRLPKNAWIKALHFFKPQQGANTNNIVFNLGNNDHGTIYVSSTPAQQQSAIRWDVDNIWVNVGSTPNERNTRIWATGTGATTQIAGGYAYIEYI